MLSAVFRVNSRHRRCTVLRAEEELKKFLPKMHAYKRKEAVARLEAARAKALIAAVSIIQICPQRMVPIPCLIYVMHVHTS